MWKDIQNYEGYYQVNEFGEVKSLAREIINKNGDVQKYPEHILKPQVYDMGSSKYATVTLSKRHKINRFLVHRLVAKAFITNTENKPFINHIDNNGLNNHFSNLEWCTHSENMLHAQKQGRLFKSQSKGGKIGSAINLLKAQKKIEILFNQKSVNSWTILSTEYSKKGKKLYLDCKCICGKLQKIELGRLYRNEVTSCKKCAKQVRDIV